MKEFLAKTWKIMQPNF